jgi:Prokaryotic homologs of the JAB domain
MNNIQILPSSIGLWSSNTGAMPNGSGGGNSQNLATESALIVPSSVSVTLSANALSSGAISSYSPFEILSDLRLGGGVNPWVSSVGADLFSQQSLEANYQSYQQSPASTLSIGFADYMSFVAQVHDDAAGQAHVQQMMIGSYGSAWDAGFQVAHDEGSVWSQAAQIGRELGYNNLTYRNQQFEIWAGGKVTSQGVTDSGGGWRSYGSANLGSTAPGYGIQSVGWGGPNGGSNQANQSSAIPGNPLAPPDSSWAGPVNPSLQSQSPLEVARHLAEALRSASARDANGRANEYGGAIFRGNDGKTYMSGIFRGPRVGPDEAGSVTLPISRIIAQNPGLQLVATWHTHTNGNSDFSANDLSTIRRLSSYSTYLGEVVAAQGDVTQTQPRFDVP